MGKKASCGLYVLKVASGCLCCIAGSLAIFLLDCKAVAQWIVVSLCRCKNPLNCELTKYLHIYIRFFFLPETLRRLTLTLPWRKFTIEPLTRAPVWFCTGTKHFGAFFQFHWVSSVHIKASMTALHRIFSYHSNLPCFVL